MQHDPPIILAHADLRSGLAIGRSLARHGISFIPAVTNPNQFACYSRYFRRRFVEVANPRVDPDKFAKQVLSLADEVGAAAIIPVSDAALGSLNAVRDRLPHQTRLMAPDREAIDAVLDKDKNVRIAEEQGVPYPRTIEVESSDKLAAAAEQLGYPVVLKRQSQQQLIPQEISDFTAEIVQDVKALRRIADRLAEYGVVPQIQKFVLGEMHNICCFAVRGDIVAAHEYISLRRGKHVGIARKIVDVDPTRLAYANKMLGAINWEGVAGVSFIVSTTQNQSWYLETNGRFWASVQGSVNAGWDFPYWAARYFLHGEVPVPPPPTVETNVTCYHTEDLRVLANYLGGGPSPTYVGKPGRLEVIWQYLRAFGPGYQSDVFEWSDPLPAMIDHLYLAAGAWRRFKAHR